MPRNQLCAQRDVLVTPLGVGLCVGAIVMTRNEYKRAHTVEVSPTVPPSTRQTDRQGPPWGVCTVRKDSGHRQRTTGRGDSKGLLDR